MLHDSDNVGVARSGPEWPGLAPAKGNIESNNPLEINPNSNFSWQMFLIVRHYTGFRV